MHTLILLAPAVIATALAQNNTNACPHSGFEVQVHLGLPSPLVTYLDNDQHYVYSRQNCSNTFQKIISPSWMQSCTRAITAICSLASSETTAAVGVWDWAWNSQSGPTCQVGLFQSATTLKLGGPLSEACCTRNFNAMLQAIPLSQPKTPNRVSVNVAKNGFPGGFFTGTTVDHGLTGSFYGQSVNGGLPSYILQGYIARKDRIGSLSLK